MCCCIYINKSTTSQRATLRWTGRPNLLHTSWLWLAPNRSVACDQWYKLDLGACKMDALGRPETGSDRSLLKGLLLLFLARNWLLNET